MGRRGKRESPTVEFEYDDKEELAYLECLVEKEIGELEETKEPKVTPLERFLEDEGVKNETWYEVYWSGEA